MTPIDPIKLAPLLARHHGVTVAPADVQAALTGIDHKAMFDRHRARIGIVHWDKTSPVNGCDAATMLEAQHHDPGGETYLLTVDGKVTFHQWFKPGVQGWHPITVDELPDVAGAHANDIAASMAHQEIVGVVTAKMGLGNG